MCYNQFAFKERLLVMESYSSGRRGAPAKGVGVEMRARVQIPHSPPESCLSVPIWYGWIFLFTKKANCLYSCNRLKKLCRIQQQLFFTYSKWSLLSFAIQSIKPYKKNMEYSSSFLLKSLFVLTNMIYLDKSKGEYNE